MKKVNEKKVMVGTLGSKKVPVRGLGPWAGFWRDRSNDEDDRDDDGDESGMDVGGDMGGGGDGGGGESYSPADELIKSRLSEARVSDYPKYVKARDTARANRRSNKGIANIPDDHSGYYDDGFGGEIHHSDASEIAGQWHSGQWSPLYALASTGHVDSSTEQEVSSLLNDISKNPSKYPEDDHDDYDNHTQIKRLHNYVVSRIKMGHHGRLV
jgi:hypothetical protein